MQEFMKDRYGVDDLTIGLGVLGMLLALIGSLAKVSVLSWIALALVIVALLRAFSKNTGARRHENEVYLGLTAKIPAVGPFLAPLSQGQSAAAGSRPGNAGNPQGNVAFNRAKRTAQRMWRERKTTLFFRCKTCGSILSVPRGKGRIRVTCPKCGTKVEKLS